MRSQQILFVADRIADAYQMADDMGAIDAFRAWWRARSIVKRRRKRRARRRAQ